MQPTIRSATLDDLPLILAIEKQAASAAHWPSEEYEKLMRTGVVLVSEQAGKMCGFVCVKAVAGEWEIENIVVAGEFLRQGTGGRLMQALIKHAVQLRVSRILLEVRESNHAARKLYEIHGFREVGRRPSYYNNPREDALLYERGGTSGNNTSL